MQTQVTAELLNLCDYLQAYAKKSLFHLFFQCTSNLPTKHQQLRSERGIKNHVKLVALVNGYYGY